MVAMEDEKADLVICDGAPEGGLRRFRLFSYTNHTDDVRPFEVTGVHDLDAYLHAELLLAVSLMWFIAQILANSISITLSGLDARAPAPRTSRNPHIQDLPLTIRSKR
jgi:23S rRNA U2552 (ribose-2'-O)-methylase RlmE/FtsJ